MITTATKYKGRERRKEPRFKIHVPVTVTVVKDEPPVHALTMEDIQAITLFHELTREF